MSNEKENIFDYLKKPSGYMAIVILIVTIIATYWVTSHFQEKKEITIQESQYNFLTRNEIDGLDVNQHIHIYYDDKEIYNPYIIRITISNTGNQEITEDDFKSDEFEIFFNENVILYDTSVSTATTKNIAEEILSKLEIKDNHLLISPFLLNANESFTLSLITNQESEIFYNFRIVGISDVEKGTKTFTIKAVLLLIILIIIALLIITFIVISIIILSNWRLRRKYEFLPSRLFMYVMMLLAISIPLMILFLAERFRI